MEVDRRQRKDQSARRGVVESIRRLLQGYPAALSVHPQPRTAHRMPPTPRSLGRTAALISSEEFLACKWCCALCNIRFQQALKLESKMCCECPRQKSFSYSDKLTIPLRHKNETSRVVTKRKGLATGSQSCSCCQSACGRPIWSVRGRYTAGAKSDEVRLK